jgi:membrane-bound inhibitor of C-type lysozyme
MKRAIVFLIVLLVVPLVILQWNARKDSHVFVCADGTNVGATYGDKQMRLRLPSGSSTLPTALSASGARYANDTLEFWEHQGTARIALRDKAIFDGCRPHD